jgi:hypothetical protein
MEWFEDMKARFPIVSTAEGGTYCVLGAAARFYNLKNNSGVFSHSACCFPGPSAGAGIIRAYNPSIDEDAAKAHACLIAGANDRDDFAAAWDLLHTVLTTEA